MTWLYPNIVVTPADVTFGEVFGSLEATDDICNKGEGVTVLDSELVELAIVLYKVELPIFLLNKEYWGHKRRFRWSNVALLRPEL